MILIIQFNTMMIQITKETYKMQFQSGDTFFIQVALSSTRIRIFTDNSNVKIGDEVAIQSVNKLVQISSNFMQQTLKLLPLDLLLFPNKTSEKYCSVYEVPLQYITTGVKADFGMMLIKQVQGQISRHFGRQCGGQNRQFALDTGKKTLKQVSLMLQRNVYSKIISLLSFIIEFQTDLGSAYLQQHSPQIRQYELPENYIRSSSTASTQIHQLTHLLGFSATMYSMYPNGNPLVTIGGKHYLQNSLIIAKVQEHYKCSRGMLLEDGAEGISSHWERRIIGSEYMITIDQVNSHFSSITLALLESTGWYAEVNYGMAENTTWGRGQGCSVFDTDSCLEGIQCQDSSYGCIWDGSAIGDCKRDQFSGCNIIKYFENTVCCNEEYSQQTLNINLKSQERGGHNSKCYFSTFRKVGHFNKLGLDYRCYRTICSPTNMLYIQVGWYILVCNKAKEQLSAPPGMQGKLICPDDLANYCQNKKFCPYHCNKEGICINGKCLCNGKNQFSPTCMNKEELQRNQMGDKDMAKGTQQPVCGEKAVYNPIDKQCVSCEQAHLCSVCDLESCQE